MIAAPPEALGVGEATTDKDITRPLRAFMPLSTRAWEPPEAQAVDLPSLTSYTCCTCLPLLPFPASFLITYVLIDSEEPCELLTME